MTGGQTLTQGSRIPGLSASRYSAKLVSPGSFECLHQVPLAPETFFSLSTEACLRGFPDARKWVLLVGLLVVFTPQVVLHGEAVQKLSRGRWKGPGDGPSPGWIVTTCSAEGSLEVRFMPFPGMR